MKNSDIEEQDLIYLRQKANQPVPLKFWLILAAVVIVFGSIILLQHNQIKTAKIEEKAVKLDKQAEKQKQVAVKANLKIDSAQNYQLKKSERLSKNSIQTEKKLRNEKFTASPDGDFRDAAVGVARSAFSE